MTRRNILFVFPYLILFGILIYPYLAQVKVNVYLNGSACSEYQVYYWTRDGFISNVIFPIILHQSGPDQPLSFSLPLAAKIIRLDPCDGSHQLDIKKLTVTFASNEYEVPLPTISSWECRRCSIKLENNYLKLNTLGEDPQIVANAFDSHIGVVEPKLYRILWYRLYAWNTLIYILLFSFPLLILRPHLILLYETVLISIGVFFVADQQYASWRARFPPVTIYKDLTVGAMSYTGLSTVADYYLTAGLILIPPLTLSLLTLRNRWLLPRLPKPLKLVAIPVTLIAVYWFLFNLNGKYVK